MKPAKKAWITRRKKYGKTGTRPRRKYRISEEVLMRLEEKKGGKK